MANEITVTGQLAYNNAALSIPQEILNFLPTKFSIAGKNFVSGTMAVPTTAGGTAIPLGNLSAPGWGMFVNLDSANYVELLTAVSGTKFPQLMAGEPALFRFDPSVTAPAAIAHTATVLMAYLILEP